VTAGLVEEVNGLVNSMVNKTYCSAGPLDVIRLLAGQGVAARLLPKIVRCDPTQATQHAYLQRNGETGATGLEPATSGVTGRVKSHHGRERTTPNGRICSGFLS
jgi:hypothetical protein